MGLYGGTTWSWTDSADIVDYADVFGMDDDADGTNDAVYIVWGATILHRVSPTSFVTFPAQPNVSAVFYGVWGTTSTDFYLVGGTPGGAQGVVSHYAGSWSNEPLPAEVPPLTAVWGTADGATVYAVGFNGVIVRRVAGTWETIKGPEADGAFFEVISGAGRDAYAVAADGGIWRIAPR